MKYRGFCVQQDNRGITLVELIVAIAIAAIVSGSIATLMFFAIRMYNNESANASIQYELQSNINMITDEIMGASAFVVVQNSGVSITDPPNPAPGTPYTKYAMFGKVTNGVTISEGVTGQRFEGVIFVPTAPVSGRFKLLMDRFSLEGTDLESIASAKYTSIIGASDQTPYLLGEDLTQFLIMPVKGAGAVTSLDETTQTYTNPIEVRVKLSFQKDGWGTKKYDKHVDDVTYLRNKVSETVYVDGTGYTLKKKEE